jgi:hypothetical protein
MLEYFTPALYQLGMSHLGGNRPSSTSAFTPSGGKEASERNFGMALLLSVRRTMDLFKKLLYFLSLSFTGIPIV